MSSLRDEGETWAWPFAILREQRDSSTSLFPCICCWLGRAGELEPCSLFVSVSGRGSVFPTVGRPEPTRGDGVGPAWVPGRQNSEWQGTLLPIQSEQRPPRPPSHGRNNVYENRHVTYLAMEQEHKCGCIRAIRVKRVTDILKETWSVCLEIIFRSSTDILAVSANLSRK